MTVSLNINADLFLKLKNTAKIAHKLVQSVSIKIQRLSVLKILNVLRGVCQRKVGNRKGNRKDRRRQCRKKSYIFSAT